eukprot:6651698-Lingulodinium_polyedra.AAC.1
MRPPDCARCRPAAIAGLLLLHANFDAARTPARAHTVSAEKRAAAGLRNGGGRSAAATRRR